MMNTLASALIPALAQLQATKPTDRETVLTRTFVAPLHSVFEALTRPESVVQWMKPPNMTLVECRIELRAGGSFRHVYQRASGARIEVRGTYDAVDAPNRFAYTETYDFSPLRIHVTTTLDQVGASTVFEQRMVYSSQEERDRDFDAVVSGATAAYANLDRYLQSLGR